MSFKFAVILPAKGPNKISRFRSWAKTHIPGLEFKLPPQVPVEATALTVRLRSAEDRDRIKSALVGELP